jgi:FkbM family methyltransferase
MKRNRFFFAFLSAVLGIIPLKADLYEGIALFQTHDKIDIDWLPQFLPYNPVIIEAGAFRGDDTCRMAKQWPRGRIFAFEPNPEAFELLQKKILEESISNIQLFNLAINTYGGIAYLNVCHGMNGNNPIYGYASSLLPLTKEMEIYCKGPGVVVPCANLDDWCTSHQIDHVDLLKLELEGMELQVLESSFQILQNTKVIYVKTQIHPYRRGMTQYSELKNFLEQHNFVLLSHRYQPGITGYAVFLCRDLFDAYFKLSLGIYQDL